MGLLRNRVGCGFRLNRARAAATQQVSDLLAPTLRDRLAESARSRWTNVKVTLPYDRGGAMIQRIRERGVLNREEYSEGGIAIEADVPADLAAELNAAAS